MQSPNELLNFITGQTSNDQIVQNIDLQNQYKVINAVNGSPGSQDYATVSQIGGAPVTQSLAVIAANNPSVSSITISNQQLKNLAQATLGTDAPTLQQVNNLIASASMGYLTSTDSLQQIAAMNASNSAVTLSNQQITNLASGGVTSTNAANIGDITSTTSGLYLPLTSTLQSIYTTNPSALNIGSNIFTSSNLTATGNQIPNQTQVASEISSAPFLPNTDSLQTIATLNGGSLNLGSGIFSSSNVTATGNQLPNQTQVASEIAVAGGSYLSSTSTLQSIYNSHNSGLNVGSNEIQSMFVPVGNGDMVNKLYSDTQSTAAVAFALTNVQEIAYPSIASAVTSVTCSNTQIAIVPATTSGPSGPGFILKSNAVTSGTTLQCFGQFTFSNSGGTPGINVTSQVITNLATNSSDPTSAVNYGLVIALLGATTIQSLYNATNTNLIMVSPNYVSSPVLATTSNQYVNFGQVTSMISSAGGSYLPSTSTLQSIFSANNSILNMGSFELRTSYIPTINSDVVNLLYLQANYIPNTATLQGIYTANPSSLALLSTNQFSQVATATATYQVPIWDQFQTVANTIVTSMANIPGGLTNLHLNASQFNFQQNDGSNNYVLIFQPVSPYMQLSCQSGLQLSNQLGNSTSNSQLSLPPSGNNIQFTSGTDHMEIQCTTQTKNVYIEIATTTGTVTTSQAVMSFGNTNSLVPNNKSYVPFDFNNQQAFDSLQPNAFTSSISTNGNYLINKTYLLANPNNCISSTYQYDLSTGLAALQSNLILSGNQMNFFSSSSAPTTFQLATAYLNLATGFSTSSTSNITSVSSGTNYASIALQQASLAYSQVLFSVGASSSTTLKMAYYTSLVDQLNSYLSFDNVAGSGLTHHYQINGADLFTANDSGVITVVAGNTLKVDTIKPATSGGFITCNPISIVNTLTSTVGNSVASTYFKYAALTTLLTTATSPASAPVTIQCGTIYSSGTLLSYSSKLAKKQTMNESEATHYAIDQLLKLPFYGYKWIDHKKYKQHDHIGVFSEDCPVQMQVPGIEYVPNVYQFTDQIFIESDFKYTIDCCTEKIKNTKSTTIKVISDLENEEEYECDLIIIGESSIEIQSKKKIEFDTQLLVYGTKEKANGIDKQQLYELSLPIVKHLVKENQFLKEEIGQMKNQMMMIMTQLNYINVRIGNDTFQMV